MWKNIVECGMPQMTTWHIIIACRTPKATDTHPEYVILVTIPLHQLLQERASMLRYMYITCLVTFLYEGTLTYRLQILYQTFF